MDRVCGMWIEIEDSKVSSLFNDETYYFCANECKDKFEKNPDYYMVGFEGRKPCNFWIRRERKIQKRIGPVAEDNANKVINNRVHPGDRLLSVNRTPGSPIRDFTVFTPSGLSISPFLYAQKP